MAITASEQLRIDKLHPDLKPLAVELVHICAEHNITIRITDTLRDKLGQDDLYAKGRTHPGTIVTQVHYPDSMHNWGVAFDYVVIRNGKADYECISVYDTVGSLGKTLSLVWGGDWENFTDRPHFQLRGYDIDSLKTTYKTPEIFIRYYKQRERETMWKQKIVDDAVSAGLIMPNTHKPDETATKWFVLAVALNLLKKLRKIDDKVLGN